MIKFLPVLLAVFFAVGMGITNIVAQPQIQHNNIEAFVQSMVPRGFEIINISDVDEQTFLNLINGIHPDNRFVHLHHILSERPISMTEIRFATREAMVDLQLLLIASVQSDLAERYAFLNHDELAEVKRLINRPPYPFPIEKVSFVAVAEHSDSRKLY